MGPDLNRRTVLGALGSTPLIDEADAAISGELYSTTAADFASYSTPTNKDLNGVVQTSRGPFAVGQSGRILARTPSGWIVHEENGLNADGKTLNAVATSDGGDNIWVCGASGTVGVINVKTGVFVDYSNPNRTSPEWVDISVTGGAGQEKVALLDTAGNILFGDHTSKTSNNRCGSVDWSSTTVDSTTPKAILWTDVSTLTAVGTAGTIVSTTDAGATWTENSFPNNDGELTAIDVSFERVLIGTNSGRLYEKEAGSWTAYEPSTRARINAVYCNGLQSFAAGEKGILYERVDSGWTATDKDAPKSFNDLAVDPEKGYPDIVVGTSGTASESGSYTAANRELAISSTTFEHSEVTYQVDGNVSYSESGSPDQRITENSDGSYSVRQTVRGYVDGAANNDLRDAIKFSGNARQFTIECGNPQSINFEIDSRKVSPARLGELSWKKAAVPLGKTLKDVVQTAGGFYAVGGGGKVLQRNTDQWTPILKSGPGSNGNNLNTADTSTDGYCFWFGGSSGALGRYDVQVNSFTNHTAPNNVSNTIHSCAVVGGAGNETVFVGTGSGQVIRGDYSDSGMAWQDPIVPGSGSAITGVDFRTPQRGYICDTNGDVFETTDGGDTWQNIGIENPGGTPKNLAASGYDLMVSGGSGRIYRYNGDEWTERKLDGKTKYAIAQHNGRVFVGGSSGNCYRWRIQNWDDTLSQTSKTIYSTLCTGGQFLPAIAVGASGTIYEGYYPTLD